MIPSQPDNIVEAIKRLSAAGFAKTEPENEDLRVLTEWRTKNEPTTAAVYSANCNYEKAER